MPDSTDLRNDIERRVIAVVEKTQKLDPGRVTAASTFEELQIDSLDGINLAFQLENEFNVSIPDDSLPQLKSIADIVEGIEKLVAAKTEG